MCIAIPSRVVATDGISATVECFGIEREVSLMMMAEPVAVGDYLVIQAGSFAIDKVDAETARQTQRLMADMIAATGPAAE